SDFLISFELEATSAGVPGSGGGTLIAGGAVSPTAIVYSGGITLNDSTRIKARVKNGSDWTALNQACFSDSRVADSLRVTEIMYHPADPNHEFIEVRNIGPDTINLAWVEFTDGIDFTFPDMTLTSDESAVVVRNQPLFEALYGTGMTIAGQYTGALSNGGEEIVLRDAFGTEILDFDYNDNWYPVTDGAGFSLNIINPSDPDPNSWDDKAAWQAGSVMNGTPGSVNPANIAPNGAVVINEVLTHSNSYPNDWIELHNTTGSPIDIGGWFLSDDRSNLKKYRIAAGQSIPPYGYKVFTQDDNFGNSASDSGRLVGFGLSELGEEVYLSSGSGGNLAGGYSVWEEFGASEWDVSFGRHVKSALAGYDVDFVSMQSMTSGAANSGPLVADVVITEIMYNAQDIQDLLGEYIELHNRDAGTVYLYDLSNPDNTWKFTKGIDFAFPAGVSIGTGQKILISRTHPDAFKAANGDPGVAVYGPFENDTELANDGEKIELSRPGDPEPGGFVPYIRVEQVNYSDGIHPFGEDPWPTNADGRGDSLHRTTLSDYANDVANWSAAAPTPGS
ncbi:MAG: lamin tail domain-containing protein, partial [Anaerohalosphaeraceae bacterium]